MRTAGVEKRTGAGADGSTGGADIVDKQNIRSSQPLRTAAANGELILRRAYSVCGAESLLNTAGGVFQARQHAHTRHM